MPVAPPLRHTLATTAVAAETPIAPRLHLLARQATPALLLTLAFAALMILASDRFAVPMLAKHMGTHIALMNFVAPALALLLHERLPLPFTSRLFTATTAQLLVLVAAHAPGALIAAHQSMAVHVLVQAALLVVSLWFWSAVFTAVGTQQWRAIAALLVTGKIFCLVGAIFTFAPRPLLAGLAGHAPAAAVADQQLAGLLMLTACPLTYVLAGVVVSVRWLAALSAQDR